MLVKAAAIADRQAALSLPGPEQVYWRLAAVLLSLASQAETSRSDTMKGSKLSPFEFGPLQAGMPMAANCVAIIDQPQEARME